MGICISVNAGVVYKGDVLSWRNDVIGKRLMLKGVDARHIVAIAQGRPDLGRDERDEPPAGVIVHHQTVVGHHVLLVAGVRDAHTQIPGDVEVTEALREGDEGVPFDWFNTMLNGKF